MTDKDLVILQKVYLQAETEIIKELTRLRSRGLIDYHADASLRRVQQILASMRTSAGRYLPKLIEKHFYVNHPDLYTRVLRTSMEHERGYQSSESLSGTIPGDKYAFTLEEQDLISRLETSAEYHLAQAANTTLASAQAYMVGRQYEDSYRKPALESVLLGEVTGGIVKPQSDLLDRFKREGITAFTDKSGRRWSLHAYADMVTRTISRQATQLAVLTRYPDRDLYRITSHRSTCPKCAPYEGRVYSKSGTSPYYPPLATAYGKIDPNGPDNLTNSWLNIHPNCLHSLVPFTEAGKTEEEIEAIRKFSDPKTNPFTKDPRSEAQVEAYKRKEEGRALWLQAFNQWEKYRLAGVGPMTFQTFLKHKLAGDEKYQAWQEAFRQSGTE